MTIDNTIESVSWVKGSRFKVNPEAAFSVIRKIGDENDGFVKPIRLLKEAENPESPIHGEFEWNDSRAAHLHRMETARKMIRSISVRFKEAPSIPGKIYVNVPIKKTEETKTEPTAYRRIDVCLSDPAYRDQVLLGALRELQSWRVRFRHLQELGLIFRSIDDVCSTIQT